MSELAYVPLAVEHAEALEELEAALLPREEQEAETPAAKPTRIRRQKKSGTG